MKEKIMIFIIGVLVGAVLATGAFFIYTQNNENTNQTHQMPGGRPPEMNGERPDMNGEEPPEKPENNSMNNSSSETTEN